MAKPKKKRSKKAPAKKKKVVLRKKAKVLKKKAVKARKAPKKVAKKKANRVLTAVVRARVRQARAQIARVPKGVIREVAPAATVAEPVNPSTSPSIELSEGDHAPAFRALSDEGKEIALEDLGGKKVVLYFYPKDDTPGCTKEACYFRDGIAKIQERGAVVLGVSVDSVESHQKFKEKYNLNFPLLADTAKKIVQDYGVWKLRSMYGREFMGIQRTTFLIGENGRIQKIFPKVDVEVHYDEVLKALG